MLDAHQLNVFLVAAEALNFTQAAKRLHMTQPSISQHIQSLEKHFGTPLFIRHGRHLELSDAGLTLVPLATDFVKQAIHIDEAMESLKGEIYGHLMVGCSTTPGKYVLPQLLTEFHREHPKVRVTCSVTSQEHAMEMLCEGAVHFALTSSAMELCTEAELCQFICDPVIMIAPLDHPWAKRTEIEPEELYEADFILRERGSGTYIAADEELSQAGISIQKLNTLLTLGNSEAIALSVQEGLGVGFVSSMVVSRLSQGRVAVVKIRGVNICRDIYVGQQARRPASAAQSAFWEFLTKMREPIADQLNDEHLLQITGAPLP